MTLAVFASEFEILANQTQLRFYVFRWRHIRKFLAKVRKGLRAAGVDSNLHTSTRKRRVNRSARQKFSVPEAKP